MLQVLKRFTKERTRQQQLERDMRIREARRRYEKFILTEERRAERLHKLALEAHVVGSHALRDKLAQIISQSDANIRLWKERMVYFEMMQEVMSQAQACANFAEAFHTMAQSIISAANPADLARIQSDLQRSMLFADQLNEMTEQMVESMDSELDGTSAVRQVDATVVLKRIVNAAEGAQSAMDNEIDGLLKEIATAKA
jgi:hypothetical protein